MIRREQDLDVLHSDAHHLEVGAPSAIVFGWYQLKDNKERRRSPHLERQHAAKWSVHAGGQMRYNNNLYEKGLFYYGSYKGFGAIFGLFWLFFVVMPIKLVKFLLRSSRH